MPIVFIADSFLVQANLLWNRDATAVLVLCCTYVTCQVGVNAYAMSE